MAHICHVYRYLLRVAIALMTGKEIICFVTREFIIYMAVNGASRLMVRVRLR